MIKQEDVGNYYVDDNNYVWQMIGWCSEPTAILMNLATKEKEHIIPSCLNALSYHKLVRENEVIKDENS